MTVHLAHRKGDASVGDTADEALRSRRAREIRSRYAGPVGQPRLSGRLLPFARAADAVVVLTHKQASDLREDLPGLEVHVIPNMIDPVPPDLSPVRDPFRVVQLGRLDAVKRVDHAIRAVGIAVRAVPGLRLEVYGRGPELEHLVELRAELGLDEVVTFPGFTEEAIGALAGAAASLMTSRREGFGLAVAESLAAGTPVVTYDVDYGPAELVEDRVNGRVVPDGSVEQLAAALVEVLSDPQSWSAMSLAAPAATARLRAEVVGAQWLDLAVEVAGRVDLPEGALLVEDLRVRRRGLVVEGVLVRKSPDATPLILGIGDTLEVPRVRSWHRVTPPDGGELVPLSAQDVAVALPWESVEQWPEAGDIIVRDIHGTALTVVGRGLPATVCPTASGPVIVGWDEAPRRVRRLPDRTSIQVVLRPTSVRAVVDEDVTVLSDLTTASVRVLGARGAETAVALDLLPGLELADDCAATVVARAQGEVFVVGRLELSGVTDRTGVRGGALGIIHWDVSGLDNMAGRGDSPARIDLCVGRSLRVVGTVEMATGRAVRIAAEGGWALVGSRSGRALLVRGRTLRTRFRHGLRSLKSMIWRED
jgi:hypothetical protein